MLLAQNARICLRKNNVRDGSLTVDVIENGSNANAPLPAGFAKRILNIRNRSSVSNNVQRQAAASAVTSKTGSQRTRSRSENIKDVLLSSILPPGQMNNCR